MSGQYTEVSFERDGGGDEIPREPVATSTKIPTVAVDWDGTVVENAWPAMGDWNPGAVECLKTLVKHAKVYIFTSRIAPYYMDGVTPRSSEEVRHEVNSIRSMLDSVGLKQVRVWNQPYKVGADVYIDDRAVRYRGGRKSWEQLMPLVLTLIGAPDQEDGDDLV